VPPGLKKISSLPANELEYFRCLQDNFASFTENKVHPLEKQRNRTIWPHLP